MCLAILLLICEKLVSAALTLQLHLASAIPMEYNRHKRLNNLKHSEISQISLLASKNKRIMAKQK